MSEGRPLQAGGAASVKTVKQKTANVFENSKMAADGGSGTLEKVLKGTVVAVEAKEEARLMCGWGCSLRLFSGAGTGPDFLFKGWLWLFCREQSTRSKGRTGGVR